MKKLIVIVIAAGLSWATSLSAHAALQIQAWTLANGARVFFVENHSIPMLDLSVEFDAGSRRDPQGKAGTASLTNAMLARGLRETAGASAASGPELSMNEAQISDAFADTAAQRGGGASSERGGASLRMLSSRAERDPATSLLARVLAQPSFPADLLARDKARTISSIREEQSKPGPIAGKAFWRLLYSPHPYSLEETPESVAAITRDDLIIFHQTHYVANRAVVAVIGDVTRSEADAIAQQLTMRLPQGTALPSLPEVPLPRAVEERIPHPASQSHILIGAPALTRGDPDFFALTVGNYILGGGGFVSRLTKEVREKRGLTYGVYSYFSPMAQNGPFQISLQTQKEHTEQALGVVRDMLAAFLRDGPTADELKAAKDNLVGGFPLRIDSNRKILENIVSIGYYGLPLDYLDTWTGKIASVTAADIKAAFNRKIAADKLATVVVGAAK